MKPHLIIKRRHGLPRDVGVPFWRDFVTDKTRRVESFHPAFDRVLAEHALRFWVTQEYPSAGGTWSAEETAAGLDRIYRLILQQDFEFSPALLERIRLIPDFEYVRPIHVTDSEIPTPEAAADVAVSTDRSRELIRLKHAHLFSKGHPNVKVAVLDTGVNLDHPEVARRVVKRADFVNLEGLDTREFVGDFLEYDSVPEDEVGHGTHVTGIIAGAGLKMPRGVAPECGVLAVRVLASMKVGDELRGAGITDNINTGIKWAVDNGADVINMSLGIKHVGGGLPHEEVIRYAIARGVSVVAASGNDGTEEKYYPGALPGVIAVGAMNPEGDVASFSSFGAPVWMIAPGTNVYSSYAQGRYALASGTSQASPFVAGAVALLKSQALARGVKLGDADVKEILKHTSDRLDQRPRNSKAGYGRLNLLDACRLLSHMLDERHSFAA